MKYRYVLLAAATANVVAAASPAFAGPAASPAAASPAPAGSAAAHKRRHRAPARQPSVAAEVRELRAEVETLRQELAEQKAAQATVAAQAQNAQNIAQADQAQIQTVQTQVAAAPTTPAVAPITQADVQNQIDTAIEKEHHTDALHFKGLTIKPGGFIELAGIYRDNFQGNDMASSFSIPFPNNRPAHTSETRFSARQSRLSLLVEGKVNPNVTLTLYNEIDFLGGAQTANSNQTNSFNPRIRQFFGSIDWNKGDSGFHLLAGQAWSLVTMNMKGITPRNELTPPQIDAQYVPGFVFARQPQVRLTGDFLNHKLWIAVSAENSATQTPAGPVPSNVTYNAPAGSGFDSANSLSLNDLPDFVGKLAYEDTIAGHLLHIEGFGLYRSFVDHLNGSATVLGSNNHATGYGFGGGIVFQLVPKLVDLQFSGLTGKGIGRYGAASLPDIAMAPDGSIHPISETMLLAGATLHATNRLDIYAFAGEELEDAQNLGTVGTTYYGVGNPQAQLVNDTGCFIEGGTCSGNTRRIRQLTAGFWDRFYQGSYGRAQVGIQYSYTQRQLFADIYGNAPQVSQNMVFLSFRYYPF